MSAPPEPAVCMQVLLQQASAPAMGPVPGAGAATLIGVLGERLCSTLQRNSPALVCTAARSAGQRRGSTCAITTQLRAWGFGKILSFPYFVAVAELHQNSF